MSEYPMYVLFFFAGVASLAFLVAWAATSSGRTFNRFGESSTHDSRIAAIPPSKTLGSQIFSQDDWIFTRERMPADAQRLFLAERKAMAFEWLNRSAAHVSFVMKIHRSEAGLDEGLSASREIRLVIGYSLFMVSYWFLMALVWFRGPFVADSFLAYCAQKVQQFDSSAGLVLDETRPVRVSRVANRS